MIDQTFTVHHPSKPPTLDSITKTIYCQNSGAVLGNLEVKIFEGQLAYLEAHSDAVYLHPFYRLSSIVLIKKLEDCLHQFQEQGWLGSTPEQLRLRLLTSAMMFNLDSIKQSQASLPSFAVAAASAGRLLGISKWFFYVSSQRLAFPLYSVSKLNDNLEWQNFKHWIDSAYDIRHSWATKAKELKRDAEQKAMSESLREIKSEHYKRIDTKKVWNWMWLQLDDKYPPARLEDFKNLFLNGDMEAHDWNVVNVDGLREAVYLHCDQGNEICFFIKKRLDGIAALIEDFQSSFTLVSKVGADKFGAEGVQTPQEALFFSEFDAKVKDLDKMPEPPKREDFASLGLFLKNQAQWNILNKRFKQIKGEGK